MRRGSGSSSRKRRAENYGLPPRLVAGRMYGWDTSAVDGAVPRGETRCTTGRARWTWPASPRSVDNAPGGVRHLILEVVAYAAKEAECNNGGRCVISLHADIAVGRRARHRHPHRPSGPVRQEVVHLNRRRHGAWTQRDEHGIPVTELLPSHRTARPGRPSTPTASCPRWMGRQRLTSPWQRLSVDIDYAR